MHILSQNLRDFLRFFHINMCWFEDQITQTQLHTGLFSSPRHPSTITICSSKNCNMRRRKSGREQRARGNKKESQQKTDFCIGDAHLLLSHRNSYFLGWVLTILIWRFFFCIDSYQFGM